MKLYVRFGSLADKLSRPKIRLCPLLSKSGQTQVQPDSPLSANSGHENVITFYRRTCQRTADGGHHRPVGNQRRRRLRIV